MNSSIGSDDNKTLPVDDRGTMQYFIAVGENVMCYKTMDNSS